MFAAIGLVTLAVPFVGIVNGIKWFAFELKISYFLKIIM